MTMPPLSLGIIKGAEWLKALNAEMFTYGQSHGYMNKNADHTSVHALAGRLQAGPSGNLELTVPSSLIKGVFDALDEPGAEFVVRNNRTECAIKVMTKEEVDKLGGTSHITERGHSYHYTLGPIVELPATGDYDKLWAISIKSDDLESIRRSYGLETSPQLGFYIPVGCKKKKVTEDNEVSKLAGVAEDPMYLHSYIPSGSIKNVKEHGLLSGNELAKPENRHLLDIARPNGDADRWLKERDERLAKSPWTTSYNGPSALFGDTDPEKIHDKHPIKRFDTTRARINLHELLKDYPTTKLEGSELIPFSDETYDALDEKGQNEFVNKRHHTLSPEEIKSLIARGQNPKDMWKDFKDTEGKYYASDVPHAHVVTPMGKIPSKYIEFDEALPVSKLASLLKLSASDLPWRDRVEVYTQNPKGKIYGGTWDSDKSFALPGGGIEAGEDPLVAALRELKEETGITAKNPRLLPIDPVDHPWSDAHRAKVKRNFAGSRTHFVLADAAGRRGNKNLDVWNASNRGYYTPAEAIDIMNNNTNYMAPAAAAARLKALQHLQSLAMSASPVSKLAATPSQDEVYHQFVKDMGEGYGDQLHHVSGGLPDVRGLSDVDVGYVSPEYNRLMDKLPKGTTAEHKDQRSIYNIPGYGRKVGLYATDNPDFIERSRAHRDVANSLAKQHPELVSAASKLKQDGMGTEPAWAQTLGMEGDPYEAMRNRSLIKLSATLKQLGNFNSY